MELRTMELASVIDKPSLWRATRGFLKAEMVYFYAGIVASKLIEEYDEPPDLNYVVIVIEDAIICKIKRGE